jgi:DNA-binding GntR family transcriptional regulator
MDAVVEDHRAILRAVEARDPTAAAASMRHHLSVTERDLQAALGELT